MNNDDNEIMLFLRAGGRDWRQAVGQMVFKIQGKVNKVVHQSILTH